MAVHTGTSVQVAEVCVEALNQDSGADKVVEIVASRDAPKIPLDQWFNV
jgi:hypothetical protein